MAVGLVFVDCEASGPCPAVGRLTSFGAVTWPGKATFHGVLLETRPAPDNPALPVPTGVEYDQPKVFVDFALWLAQNVDSKPTMISDNPAFDWQWINDGFWRYCGNNPFGFSARRIGDFFAGLTGNLDNHNGWKRLRPKGLHDHHPVHDALANLAAFERIVKDYHVQYGAWSGMSGGGA